MVPFTSNRTLIMVVLVSAIAIAMLLGLATSAAALPSFATATGQPCSTCHVNPAGGGALTATGQAFAAVPTHDTDPAGAFASITKASPTPSPSASALPSAGNGLNVGILGLVAVVFAALGWMLRRLITAR